MNRKELEKRLVGFSTSIIAICQTLRFDAYTVHLPKQIVRSGSSALLNYGEAQSAESKADFVHKLSIVLKELRETHLNLQLIRNSVPCDDPSSIEKIINENNELISIFQKSVKTLQGK